MGPPAFLTSGLGAFLSFPPRSTAVLSPWFAHTSSTWRKTNPTSQQPRQFCPLHRWFGGRKRGNCIPKVKPKGLDSGSGLSASCFELWILCARGSQKHSCCLGLFPWPFCKAEWHKPSGRGVASKGTLVLVINKALISRALVWVSQSLCKLTLVPGRPQASPCPSPSHVHLILTTVL